MPNLGELTVVSTKFLIALFTVTALAWSILLGRLIGSLRHRGTTSGPSSRRHASTWLVSLAAMVLTVLLAADGVNSYYSYLPNVSDVVDAVANNPPPRLSPAINSMHAPVWPDGKTVLLRIPDNGSGFGGTEAWVWLPPQYFRAPAHAFPVVYLFHGSPGMPKDWFHGGNAGRIADALAAQHLPAIVVAPQMSKDWLDDPECVDGAKERVETHLLRDVIPTVDAQLRTVRDRSERIFAGMSAGGYCALNLGLRNRTMVSTILDLSGYTMPTHSGGMVALFGKSNLAEVAANSPDVYAKDLSSLPPMRIWLDSGTDDKDVLHQMSAIAPVLTTDGMQVQLHTRPGSHTYSVWRPALRESLTWGLEGLPVP